ncbi:hypothetical protein V5O48_007822 [Marasmius crinis-equi]|uniref:Transcription factor hoxa13 n=1 Tax=Marasmius crinis-equi TaxID=585013 RepID=A0ABR3FG15_9AGAR
MVVKKQRTIVTGPAGPSTPGPALASRTNSTQALPKSSHKPTQAATAKTNPNGSLKGISKKKEKKKAKGKTSVGFLDTLLLLFLSAFTIYAYNTCSSSDPITLTHTLDNPLCRSLYRYKTYVVDPYILPPLQNAYDTVITHPTVEKQLKQIEPYVERVRPHVDRAARVTGHYAGATYSKVIRPTWNNQVVPVSRRTWNVASTQYQKSIHPHIQPYLAKVSQQLHPYTSKITSYSNSISSTASEIYTQAHPYFARAARYLEVAYHHGEHYGSIIGDYSHRVYVVLRPYLLTAYRAITATGCAIYQRVKPFAVEGWETYVDPHLRRIWEKVVELSGKKDVNGNGTNGGVQATSPYSAKASASTAVAEDETKASAVEETGTSTTASTASAASATETAADPVEVPAKPEVPEEPVVPVAAVTPTEAHTHTTEELAAASSVIADRAPPAEVKSSLIEEIASSSSSIVASSSSSSPSPTSTSVQATEELESASSVISARHPPSGVVSSLVEEVSATESSIAGSPSSTPDQESEGDVDAFLSDLGLEDSSTQSTEGSDDELDSFLSDLGLDEDGKAGQNVEQEQEQEQVEEQAQPPQQEEESPEARAARIKAKRDEIEGRHTKWEEKVAKLLDDTEKEIRDFLNAVRVIAANAVTGKKPDPAHVATVESKVDMKTLTSIDGVPVHQILNSLEKESERLLSGVEGWVKRESAVDSSKASSEEKKRKLAKLEQLVTKVKERFDEKVNNVRTQVHQWFRGVKDLEANECLRHSRDIKTFTDRAQTDIGMDYAWLENVTYEDWQRYHDLMRASEHFDKYIRYIQNPTQNEHPGVVPNSLIPLLTSYQSNLEEKRSPVNAEGEVVDNDPLLPALDALGSELELLVLGWEWRAKEIENRGREAVEGATEPEPEVVTPEKKEEETKVEEKEEPVKILPISPSPAKEELEGAAQLPLIGKSKEQVEQAFKVAGVGADGEEL